MKAYFGNIVWHARFAVRFYFTEDCKPQAGRWYYTAPLWARVVAFVWVCSADVLMYAVLPIPGTLWGVFARIEHAGHDWFDKYMRGYRWVPPDDPAGGEVGYHWPDRQPLPDPRMRVFLSSSGTIAGCTTCSSSTSTFATLNDGQWSWTGVS